MKKNIIILIATVFVSISYAQNSIYYKYDNLNRISKVTYPNGIIVTYSYDVLGNRTTKAIVGNKTELPMIFDEKLFIVTPNPVKTMLYIKSQQNVQQGNFVIFTIDGKIIKEGLITSSSMNINVSNLSKGSYIIQLNSENKYTTVKFIKE